MPNTEVQYCQYQGLQEKLFFSDGWSYLEFTSGFPTAAFQRLSSHSLLEGGGGGASFVLTFRNELEY
jgi:hypothetical protein